jgi:hypothetical protein
MIVGVLVSPLASVNAAGFNLLASCGSFQFFNVFYTRPETQELRSTGGLR